MSKLGERNRRQGVFTGGRLRRVTSDGVTHEIKLVKPVDNPADPAAVKAACAGGAEVTEQAKDFITGASKSGAKLSFVHNKESVGGYIDDFYSPDE